MNWTVVLADSVAHHRKCRSKLTQLPSVQADQYLISNFFFSPLTFFSVPLRIPCWPVEMWVPRVPLSFSVNRREQMSRCRPKGEDEPPAACRPTKSRVYKINKVKSNVSTLSISDLKLFIELSSHRRLHTQTVDSACVTWIQVYITTC